MILLKLLSVLAVVGIYMFFIDLAWKVNNSEHETPNYYKVIMYTTFIIGTISFIIQIVKDIFKI